MICILQIEIFDVLSSSFPFPPMGRFLTTSLTPLQIATCCISKGTTTNTFLIDLMKKPP